MESKLQLLPRSGLEQLIFLSLFLMFGCAGSSLLQGLFFSCGEQGLLFIAVQVRGRLTWGLLVAEHRF